MANSILSKRQERREKRKVIWEEKKSLKKLKKKAKAKNINNVPELDMSEDAVLKRRERQIGRRELFQMAAEEGLKIVIDCGFEDQMSEKEKKSLSQQIMFSYGVNKRSSSPSSVFLTSLHGEILQNLERISGFKEWLGFGHSTKSYMDVFNTDSLVYLTADSPNTITTLCLEKVYIIGGIVDRNRLKGITYRQAQEQGIATARLPLDQYVEMGSSTKVLTVNHVFEILVQYFQEKDWSQATLETLPIRKNVQSK